MPLQDRTIAIERVDLAIGAGGHWINDQEAVQAGAEPDGFFFKGAPAQPGFERIREPSLAYCLVVTLADGETAYGDCVTVANLGVAGRPPPLRAEAATRVLERLRALFQGRAFDGFRSAAAALDGLDLGGLDAPVAYGMSQALLSAAALAARRPMARVLVDEYGLPEPTGLPGFAASCGGQWHENADKAIARRCAMLPQSAMQTRAHVEALPEYVSWLRTRMHLADDPDYRPDLHFDFHAALGRLYGGDEERVVAYLADVVERAGPHKVYFEDPMPAESAGEALERMGSLKAALARRGVRAGLIADEWANGGGAPARFAASGCCDAIQIKLPDNGSLTATIDAIAACKTHGLSAYLGGSCNETDVSVRASVHVGVAHSVWRMFAKPGLGLDEAIMIMTNEMARARLALEATRG